MAYTNIWTTNDPIMGNNTAKDLDDAIRRLRVDMQERLLTVTGEASMTDPLTINSLTTLKTLADTKATINSGTNYLPKKTGAGTLGNSSILDDGTTVSVGEDLTLAALKILTQTTHYYGVVITGTPVVFSGFENKITFGAVSHESGVAWNNGSDRFVVNKAGLYLVSGNIAYHHAAANKSMQLFVKLNGNSVQGVGASVEHKLGDGSISNNLDFVSVVVCTAPTDYIELWLATVTGLDQLDAAGLTIVRLY